MLLANDQMCPRLKTEYSIQFQFHIHVSSERKFNEILYKYISSINSGISSIIVESNGLC